MSKKNYRFIYPLFLFLCAATLYGTTLLPGPGGTVDSREFQFVPHVLGIGHPTGAPLYMVLNYVFTNCFPLGSVAFRANLLSAVFSIAICLIFFRLLVSSGVKDNVAFFVSLLYASSRSLWSQSVIAELYTLHMLFFVLVLYFLFRWRSSTKIIDLYIACGLYAFSFGVHLTSITWLLAIVCYIFAVNKKVFLSLKNYLVVLTLVALGALQYFYLYWRSTAPEISYVPYVVDSWKAFIWYVTGAEFKGAMYHFTFMEFLEKSVFRFFKYYFVELNFLFPLAVYGFYKHEDRKVKIFFSILFASVLGYALGYDIPDIFVYFLPLYVISFVYVAIGAQILVQKIQSAELLPVLCLSSVVAFTAVNGMLVTQHFNTADAEYFKQVMDYVDKDAVVIGANWDQMSYLLYYSIGEKRNESKAIYIPVKYSLDDLLHYMDGRQRLFLPVQGKTLDFGKAVYFLGPDKANVLMEHGYTLEKQGLADLYKAVQK